MTRKHLRKKIGIAFSKILSINSPKVGLQQFFFKFHFIYGCFACINVHGIYAWCSRPEEGFGSSETGIEPVLLITELSLPPQHS